MANNTSSDDLNSSAALPDHFEGEQLRIVTGPRSGATIIISVHSTLLGPAIGGCRLRRYPSFTDGLADVLKLSKAMSYKCAIGGIAVGGGKTVVIQPETFDRRDLLLDIGDAVEAMGGAYLTAVDIGTTAEDMVTVKERTSHVVGLPEMEGGSGSPADATARGVLASMRAVALHLFGTESLSGRHIVISGLGGVGSRMARALTAQGAKLTVTDVDGSKASIAAELGATWTDPENALAIEADIVAPAGVGGILDRRIVNDIRCRAIVGPANNQLTLPSVADALHARGVLWAPDFLVNGGGVVYAGAMEVEHLDSAAAEAKVEAIGTTLAEVLSTAEATGTTPLAVAQAMAEKRLQSAARNRRVELTEVS